MIEDVRWLSSDRQNERWAMKDAYALRPEEWAAIRRGASVLGRLLLKVVIALLIVALWGAIGYSATGGSPVFLFATLLLLVGVGTVWQVTARRHT